MIGRAMAADSSASRTIADRAACSSLIQCKQPTAKALQTVAGLGYRWVDLSCLSWASHVSVPKLMEDFDKQAARVEAALAVSGSKVANLTFDSCYDRPFDQYEREFQAVVSLAVRLKTGQINLMAPSNKADRNEVAARMKKLQAMAARDGVILTLETHCHQITERPADALWLCQEVPGLGLTLDPSHYYAGPNQGDSTGRRSTEITSVRSATHSRRRRSSGLRSGSLGIRAAYSMSTSTVLSVSWIAPPLMAARNRAG